MSFPDLDRVVLTALQRDPLQRYGTVQLFGDDLRRCLDGRPISARPKTVTYTTRKAIERNPVVSAIAAAAVVVALAGGWLGINAYLQRVELQAKQEQLAQFVAAFAGKVAGWSGGASSATEKVADMRAANELMASDTVRTLSERAPDPPRVKRLFIELRNVLDRADAASREEPTLRKEIALVYRRIGDVESRAPLPAIADKQQAARSYQRAAADRRRPARRGRWLGQPAAHGAVGPARPARCPARVGDRDPGGRRDDRRRRATAGARADGFDARPRGTAGKHGGPGSR